jgi:hypothetical protein
MKFENEIQNPTKDPEKDPRSTMAKSETKNILLLECLMIKARVE